MTQKIVLGFPRTSLPGTDSQFLAKLATAPGAGDPIRLIASGDGGSMNGAMALCADGEVSQTVANAMAQRIKDAGGPASGYSAAKIDNAGVYSALVAPTPT